MRNVNPTSSSGLVSLVPKAKSSSLSQPPRLVTNSPVTATTAPLYLVRPSGSPSALLIGASSPSGVKLAPTTIRRLPHSGTIVRPANSLVIKPSSSPSSSLTGSPAPSRTRQLLVNAAGTTPVPISKPEPTSGKLNPQSSCSTTSQSSPQKTVLRTMQVRVPNRCDKRFSVLRSYASDRLDLSTCPDLFLQRENNLKQHRASHGLPSATDQSTTAASSSSSSDRGANSEFGKEARELARQRKYGSSSSSRSDYQPDDQSWLLTIGKGKSSRRRFRAVREGNASDNMQHFVFCQCKDGNFDAYPIDAWYKVKPEINYRFLRDDEAEAEYSRMNKTMNLFNVMIKRKLNDSDDDEAGGTGQVTAVDKELGKELKYLSVATTATTGAVGSSNSDQSFTSKAPVKRSGRLKLTDLDEELDASGDSNQSGGESDNNEMVEGDSPAKRRPQVKKRVVGNKRHTARRKRRRMGTKRRRRKRDGDGSSEESNDDFDDEVEDESEVDDHEGDEVDYMTNSSSDEEKLSIDERDKIYDETGVAEESGLKALLTDISSDEDEPKLNNDDEDDQDASRAEDDTVGRQEKSGEVESLNSSSSSSPYSSSSDSSSSDDNDGPDADASSRKKVKRRSDQPVDSNSNSQSGALKRSLTDPSPRPAKIPKTVSSTVPSAPASSTVSTSSSTSTTTTTSNQTVDSELLSAVRKYLIRKPITVTDLLRKIRLRKLVGKNEDPATALANVLRQLRPIRQMINGQHALSLKQ